MNVNSTVLNPPMLDEQATDGLLGIQDSLAYRVNEIERHFHSYERWFGAANTPDGEIHVADRIGTSVTAFQADAGNNTWGDWLQILGSSDTPDTSGSAYYDLHEIFITTAERAATYFVQLAKGIDGDTALTNNTYSEFMFLPAAASRIIPIVIQSRRYISGTKAWIRCFCPGQNTGTMDFFIGLHEYEG